MTSLQVAATDIAGALRVMRKLHSGAKVFVRTEQFFGVDVLQTDIFSLSNSHPFPKSIKKTSKSQRRRRRERKEKTKRERKKERKKEKIAYECGTTAGLIILSALSTMVPVYAV